jgi:hypothetical protein
MLKAMPRPIIALLSASGVIAQLVFETPREPLPKTPPAVEALPESRSPIDPDEAYRELVSGDAERVLRAMAVNMNDDPKLERVLIIDNLRNTSVIVFAQKDGQWWSVGAGLCGAPVGHCPTPFVELKQTVWYGTYDLVIHTDGKIGLGLSESHLRIYRMFRGRFYPVLDFIESAHNMSGVESNNFRFRGPGTSDTATVVVHRTQEFRGRKTSECIPHVWNVEKFAFMSVPPTRALCAPRE